MKRRHHTPEQIIRILAEGEKLLGQGQPVEEVAASPGYLRIKPTNKRILAQLTPPPTD